MEPTRYAILLGFMILLTTCLAVKTPDEILDENLTLKKLYTLATYDGSLRSLNIPVLGQLLYVVLKPIQQVANTALALVCSSIDPLVTLVESFRSVVLSNLISLVNVLETLVIFLPTYSTPLAVIKTLMTVTNTTIGNLTSLASTYGCTVTTNIESALDSILSSIVGIFS